MRKMILALLALCLLQAVHAQNLITAIEAKDYASVEGQLQSGAKVNKPVKSGQFPLWVAVWNNDTAMVKLLLKYGADVNQGFKAKDGQKITCLDIACQEGLEAVVRLLVEGGAGVDIKSVGGHTPLRVAARNGRTEIVKYLVAKGAEIDTKGNDLATPLEHAAGKGHLEIVAFLLEQGANINHQDKDRDCPLGEAAKGGREEVVKYLLAKGADTSLKNNDGHTPQELARLAGQNKIAELIAAAGK